MNFDVKTEKLSDDQYVISLAGEVDLYTAPEFKQQLLEVIDQGGRDVVVDLTDTYWLRTADELDPHVVVTPTSMLVAYVDRRLPGDGRAAVPTLGGVTFLNPPRGVDEIIRATDERIAEAKSTGAPSHITWNSVHESS